MANFADTIAQTVFNIYESCPKNGKPNCSEPFPSEFTVMAAIVATKNGRIMDKDSIIEESDLLVISMATGTKCAGKGKEDLHGFITSDSHAEVLARRGFVRWLAKSVLAIQNCPTLYSDSQFPLEILNADTEDICKSVVPYVLKKDWQFFLYVSDSPCGDASIYPRMINTNQVYIILLSYTSFNSPPCSLVFLFRTPTCFFDRNYLDCTVNYIRSIKLLHKCLELLCSLLMPFG
jgi:tRNA-specific adenosine deaminase 1